MLYDMISRKLSTIARDIAVCYITIDVNCVEL